MKDQPISKVRVLSEFRASEPKLSSPECAVAPQAAFGPRRILVPLDFSECSEKALQYAIPFARQFGAELVLIHVIQSYVPLSEFSAGDPGYSEETAQKRLCALQQTLGNGIKSRVTVRVGNPYTQIVETARKLGVDLIILSTHGHTGLAHVFLGSTTERVVRRAGCPVLVVRENENEFVPELAITSEAEQGFDI